jgi:hypothetical protein
MKEGSCKTVATKENLAMGVLFLLSPAIGQLMKWARIASRHLLTTFHIVLRVTCGLTGTPEVGSGEPHSSGRQLWGGEVRIENQIFTRGTVVSVALQSEQDQTVTAIESGT